MLKLYLLFLFCFLLYSMMVCGNKVINDYKHKIVLRAISYDFNTASSLNNRNHVSQYKNVSGGLLLINMTGYSPFPTSGILTLNLFPGKHIINFLHPLFEFEELIVQIQKYNETPIFSFINIGRPATKLGRLVIGQGDQKNMVDLITKSSRVYKEASKSFDILSFLKNPMILMSLASLFIVGAFPKLMQMFEEENNNIKNESADSEGRPPHIKEIVDNSALAFFRDIKVNI